MRQPISNGIGLRCLALSVEDQTETPISKPLIKAIRNKALLVNKRGGLNSGVSKQWSLIAA